MLKVVAGFTSKEEISNRKEKYGGPNTHFFVGELLQRCMPVKNVISICEREKETLKNREEMAIKKRIKPLKGEKTRNATIVYEESNFCSKLGLELMLFLVARIGVSLSLSFSSSHGLRVSFLLLIPRDY